MKSQARGFLERLAESKFLGFNDRSGHPWDNPAEFLATFVRSFSHPQWENQMQVEITNDPTFGDFYILSLRMVQALLRSHDRIPQTAPIFSEIQTKLDRLQKF